ncbi:MAG: hypothetical protein LUG51_02585 [Tannerellaceae bacterium]|nr:hypothetical protein [Tannerellaceae bacterium]
MDQLKKFINKNREAFEEEKLPAGHFERFEKKLPEKSAGKNLRIVLYTLIVAASVALLFFFNFQYQQSFDRNHSEQAVCEQYNQFQDVKMYYHIQMGEILTEMEKLNESSPIPGGKKLLEESKEVITANMRFEEEILPSLPCSNEGLFAMSQHYRNSLESLNIMLKQMKYVSEKEYNQQ